MLTQEPVPDPKCELNITSFLTLPHPLHCLICAKDIMVILLLLQVMGDGKVGGGSFMLGFGWGDRGWVSCFFYFLFCFCAVVLSWLVDDSLLCLFQCSFFTFFVSGPFKWALLVHRNCCCCFVKLFQKSGFRSLICGFP